MRPNIEWDDDDIATAASQGWRLVYVWDEKHERLEYQMRTVKGDMRIDPVNAGLGKLTNKLAVRAMKLVFESRIGSLRPSQRKTRAKA